MCLILIANRVHPDFPLVIAANRDEYFTRPTQAAHFWNSSPEILAGRDLSAGGSWMGVTRNGRFAAVTNVRNPRQPPPDNPMSRGQLVSNYLLASTNGVDYLSSLENQNTLFNGYNLICGDRETLWYGSNCCTGIVPLRRGFYGLSNAGLDSPWPKVEQGKAALQQCLSLREFQPEMLLELLNDRQRAPDEALPDTGVGLQMERVLSSRFIADTQLAYGTRSSTAFILANSGEATFIEWSWDQDGHLQDRVEHRFMLALD